MIFSIKIFSIVILSLFFLRVAGPCNCKRNGCTNSSRTETGGIWFRLKDRVTGNDLFPYNGMSTPAPDSIKLKNIKTGLFYALFTGNGGSEISIYSEQYKRPAGIVDSLVFLYGSSVPDTLIVYTDLINGLAGR